MNYKDDQRIVMTLDAGGTNFVFSAIRGFDQIIEPVRLKSAGNDLEKSVSNIIDGFTQVKDQLDSQPVAISFAFPGPSDYQRGIIGDLVNLPAYRGGVALAALLEKKFSLPVFINNDGNLFGLGEAIAGFKPYVNNLLKEHGCEKRYRNLIGVTLGTGFGGSVIIDNHMLIGDNSAGGEIWAIRNKIFPDMGAEESVSIRGLKMAYSVHARIDLQDCPEPHEISAIARGELNGDKKAAKTAFKLLGQVAGDALASAATLVDGLIVIGGGLAKSSDLFLDTIVAELNSSFATHYGTQIDRMELKCYNFESKNEVNKFLNCRKRDIKVPFSDQIVSYDPEQRICIGVTKLGTSRAISMGAYAFALQTIDEQGIA